MKRTETDGFCNRLKNTTHSNIQTVPQPRPQPPHPPKRAQSQAQAQKLLQYCSSLALASDKQSANDKLLPTTTSESDKRRKQQQEGKRRQGTASS